MTIRLLFDALMTWLALQVEGMLTPSEGGLQAQLLEIMRMLLDSETMDTVSFYIVLVKFVSIQMGKSTIMRDLLTHGHYPLCPLL